jgi:hypothetical protein
MMSSSILFPPESNPYGVSYSEWTARWWNWLLSIPSENNPANDLTGMNGTLNQDGPVWFLAGTVGGMARRTCTIPSGLSILLPILNHGGTFADEPTISSEDELVFHTRNEIELISKLEVQIDELNITGLDRYRVQSPVFEVVLPTSNLFGGNPGPTRGFSDGYWLFIKPFGLGNHHIHTFGSCRAGRVIVGIDWNIRVA